MRPMVLEGVIERRLLINFRVDPGALEQVLPIPFRPQRVNGMGVAGICLLRLGSLRPKGFPPGLGLRSENVAHRIAVEWDSRDGPQRGVYIPRRDSASLINVAAGGRLFPGVHHRAAFSVEEAADRVSVGVRAKDRSMQVSVSATISGQFAQSRLFSTFAEASRFFESGSLGYSDTSDPGHFDGLRLHTDAWAVEPLSLDAVRSSFFEGGVLDRAAAELDCGLIMRNVAVTWLPAPRLACETCGQFRSPASFPHAVLRNRP